MYLCLQRKGSDVSDLSHEFLVTKTGCEIAPSQNSLWRKGVAPLTACLGDAQCVGNLVREESEDLLELKKINIDYDHANQEENINSDSKDKQATIFGDNDKTKDDIDGSKAQHDAVENELEEEQNAEKKLKGIEDVIDNELENLPDEDGEKDQKRTLQDKEVVKPSEDCVKDQMNTTLTTKGEEVPGTIASPVNQECTIPIPGSFSTGF